MIRLLYIATIVSIFCIVLNIIFISGNDRNGLSDPTIITKPAFSLENWQEIGSLNYLCEEISERHIYSLMNFIESVTDSVLVEFSIDYGRSVVKFEKEKI